MSRPRLVEIALYGWLLLVLIGAGMVDGLAYFESVIWLMGGN